MQREIPHAFGLVLPLLATLISLASLYVVYRTFRNAVLGERHEAFFYLHQYLAHGDFTAARMRMRRDIYKKEYARWDEEDREMANRICASYDQASILLENDVVSAKLKAAFLRGSWGESICDQYELLRPFLDDHQTPWKTGREFFKHFGALYNAACEYHRKQMRIISGGQTGADRAALDVARELGLPSGGWVPDKRWATDWTESDWKKNRDPLATYPNMEEVKTGEPVTDRSEPVTALKERTLRNVRDSTATLILTTQASRDKSPGTTLTKEIAENLPRPCKEVQADLGTAVTEIRAWLDEVGRVSRINVLNVAGPRASEAPDLYPCAKRVLMSVLSSRRSA